MRDEDLFPLVVTQETMTSTGKAVVVVDNHAALVEAICASLDLYPETRVIVEKVRYVPHKPPMTLEWE